MFVSQVSLNEDNKALNEVVAGPGDRIPVALSAAGLAGVKQVEVTVTVSPAEAFDLEASTFAGSSAFSLAAPAVEVSGNQVRGGAVVLSDAVDGDADLGTFILVTSDSFTEEMEADIVVHSVSLGPSSGVRDYLDIELLSRSMHLNRPDPVLVATAPLVGNALTSGADAGPVDDDSPGEITYSVNFTNLWGEPGEGQLILWDVYNRSMEWISVLGIGTIPPMVARSCAIRLMPTAIRRLRLTPKSCLFSALRRVPPLRIRPARPSIWRLISARLGLLPSR